jgi:hypothetical protein
VFVMKTTSLDWKTVMEGLSKQSFHGMIFVNY